jgi:hypothetical protein
MTVDNAIKRLLDSEQELSYSQRIAIVDLIESLKCIYVPIKNYEGLYEISLNGDVKACNKIDERGFTRQPKILKPCINKPGYMFVRLYKDKKPTMKLIHRLVAENFLNDFEPSRIVDHIDGNPLNNIVTNLRMATQSNNIANSNKSKNTSSKYKGVSLAGKNNWSARIQKNKESINIGVFSSELDAARAYDIKARQLFGRFAKTNAMLGLL